MNPPNKTTGLTIGIDLGDRRHTVCVLSANGDIVTEEAIPNTRDCLEAFAQRYPGAVIVLETGTHSPWVSRLFEARGHRVLVANARKLRAISQSQAVAIRRRSFAHSVFIVGTVAGVGYAALLEFRVGTVASPILAILWLVCILIYVGLRVFPRSLAEDMDPRWHLNPWRSALQNLSEGRTQVEAIALLAGPPLARMLFSFLYFGLK